MAGSRNTSTQHRQATLYRPCDHSHLRRYAYSVFSPPHPREPLPTPRFTVEKVYSSLRPNHLANVAIKESSIDRLSFESGSLTYGNPMAGRADGESIQRRGSHTMPALSIESKETTIGELWESSSLPGPLVYTLGKVYNNDAIYTYHRRG